MTRPERITAACLRHDVPKPSRRKPMSRRPRTSDRQDPCRTCGQPWAYGFDHTTCKET